MDKICVLVYDALDINLVEEFDLPNLKQKEYGKTDISEFEIKSTPIICSSFLAGKNLQYEFFNPPTPKVKKISSSINEVYQFIRWNISPQLARSLSETFKDLGLLKKLRRGNVNSRKNIREINVKTLLDFFDSPKCVNVPTFNQKHWRINYSLRDVIQKKISESEYESLVWKHFEENKKDLMDSLDNNFILAWFKPPDLLGHIYRPNLDKMLEIYSRMDQLTKEVREAFDGWILVIGDHGMEPLGRFGDHSNLDYGYYSSNIELGLNNPKITDFYEIIKRRIFGKKGEKIKKKTRKKEEKKTGKKEDAERKEKSEEEEEADREKMLKRLKELGYW